METYNIFYDLESSDNVEDISRFHYSRVCSSDEKKLAKEINIDRDEFHGYNSWYIIDGEYYYFKYKYAFIELFISELFNDYNLRTPEYKVVKTSNAGISIPKTFTGIMSKNFRKPNLKYEELDTFLNNRIRYPFWATNDRSVIIDTKEKLESKLSKKNFETFYKEICTLSALDFFTGQTDRYGYNLLVETNSRGNARLAPITDNGMALRGPINYDTSIFGKYMFPIYINIFNGEYDTTSINENNYKDYPNVERLMNLLLSSTPYRKTMESLLNVNIVEILKRTIEKYKVLVKESEIKEVDNYFNGKKIGIEKSLELSHKINRV